MIWKIAKKEFLLNLMTFKFAVGTILCVVLMAVFMPVLINDYQQRLKDYNANVTANEAELRKVKVYKNIMPTICRPPTILSVFCEGIEKRLSNSAKIEIDSVPEISHRTEGVNPYLSIFPTFDVSLILKVVISILALLMACDAVSGERELGTLKLILSGTIARHQLLFGKLLAGLMILTITITVTFIVGLLILQFSPIVALARLDWIQIGLMYIASLIFISVMYNIGLLFSCLARSPSISLVLGLFFWIIFVVVIPNGSIYLATQIHPLEPEEKMLSQLKLVSGESDNKLEEIRGKFPGGLHSDGDGAFGNWCILVCDNRSMEDYPKRYSLEMPLRIEYADKLWQIEHHYFNSLSKQKTFGNNLARISPTFLYENTMSALSGTDLTSFQHFVDRAKIYRNNVIEYICSKTKDFSLPCLFTPCKKDDALILGKKLESVMQAQDVVDKKNHWRDIEKWMDEKKKTVDTVFLDLQDIPQFTYQSHNNTEIIVPYLASSIFIAVLIFALSFVVFLKYDVR